MPVVVRNITAAPGPLASLLFVACLGVAPSARAYSSFADYIRSIEEGGGGGRLFTGTPADAHGCDVCHRGAPSLKLDITGMPSDGYEPGKTYEILLQWPAGTPHAALIAEFTDLKGAPAGITALAPYASWPPAERCADGDFPAADVCRLSGDNSGCCRDLEPERDACSFPDERSVLWVLDCGSKRARVLWTAPPAAAGDVWFGTGLVTSDVKNDARGDGVTVLRRRLRVAGTPLEVDSAVANCQAPAAGGVRGCRLEVFVISALAAVLRVRSRTRARRRR